MGRDDNRDDAYVDILNLGLSLGDRRVLNGLSAHFPRGKISVILGASGVGKTTLLRVIGSLQKPDWGEVWVGDQEISSLTESEARRFRRTIGMMFQRGALLDWMSVFDNLALPLREHTELDDAEIADRIARQFEAVGLQGVDPLLPAQLSGGMTKRVALARAMIREPEILLCDEPFSGPDPVAVRLIESLLVEVNRRVGLTMILTSHHISSTMRMADQVTFLADGTAVCGTPEELSHSRDARIKSFLEAAGSQWGDLGGGEAP